MFGSLTDCLFDWFLAGAVLGGFNWSDWWWVPVVVAVILLIIILIIICCFCCKRKGDTYYGNSVQ